MNVTVLGSGRWGTFLAVYHSRRNNVKLWGLSEAPDFQELMATRKNAYLELPDNLELEPDLEKALNHAEYIVISISAQQLRNFCQRINQYDVSGKTFILCYSPTHLNMEMIDFKHAIPIPIPIFQFNITSDRNRRIKE